MKKLIPLLIIALLFSNVNAQIAKTQVVQLSASAGSTDGVTLKWPQENFTGTFKIFKRASQSNEDWGAEIASVPGNLNTFTDASVKQGQAFEYLVAKNNGSANIALGYIYVGNRFEPKVQKKGIILLIDQNILQPLTTELETLKTDLAAENYSITEIIVERTEKVTEIKQKITQAYDAATLKPACLFIIGKVAVPYSGNYSVNGDAPPPDGHIEGSGNHTGAWPADVYYGIFDDESFADKWVNCTTGNLTRNHNIPGDGKWDQTKLPATPSLEIGRVDLSNMTTFNKSDTVLLKAYFKRNHQWRTGAWKVRERALIDNNFASLNLASTGYANFPTLVGQDSVFDNLDYFPAQKNGSFLWSYGCGAGSFTSCSGVGNTANFVNDSFENVFTILAGSYFGDWDIANNFLRAPLASKSLASFWGGIPKWYVHHMALGDRLGKGTLISQTNEGFYFTGNFNASQRSMHIALMGDPTLRQRNLPPVKTLSAVSANKQVSLNWNSAGAGQKYHVYIYDSLNSMFQRVSKSLINDTFFTDKGNHYTGNYTYAVFAAADETCASGSYLNLGGGAFATVNHINGLQGFRFEPIAKVYPNPVKAGEALTIAFANLPFNDYILDWYDLSGKYLGSNQPKQNNPIAPMLQPGCYLLKITANDLQFVQRMVIY